MSSQPTSQAQTAPKKNGDDLSETSLHNEDDDDEDMDIDMDEDLDAEDAEPKDQADEEEKTQS